MATPFDSLAGALAACCCGPTPGPNCFECCGPDVINVTLVNWQASISNFSGADHINDYNPNGLIGASKCDNPAGAGGAGGSLQVTGNDHLPYLLYSNTSVTFLGTADGGTLQDATAWPDSIAFTGAVSGTVEARWPAKICAGGPFTNTPCDGAGEGREDVHEYAALYGIPVVICTRVDHGDGTFGPPVYNLQWSLRYDFVRDASSGIIGPMYPQVSLYDRTVVYSLFNPVIHCNRVAQTLSLTFMAGGIVVVFNYTFSYANPP